MSNNKVTTENREGTQELHHDQRTNSNIDEVNQRDSVVKSFTDTVDNPAMIHGNDSISRELLKETGSCRTKTPLEEQPISSQKLKQVTVNINSDHSHSDEEAKTKKKPGETFTAYANSNAAKIVPSE